MTSQNQFSEPRFDHPILDHFVSIELGEKNGLENVRTQLVILTGYVFLAALGFFGGIYLAMDFLHLFGLLVGGFVAIAATLVSLKWIGWTVAGHWISFVGFTLVFGIAISTGGMMSPAFPWLLIAPLFAQFFSGFRAGVGWGVAVIVALVVMYLLDSSGTLVEQQMTAEQLRLLWPLSIGGLAVVACGVLEFALSEKSWVAAQLADKTRRLRMVLETAPNGILSLDDRGRIQEMNRAAEKMFDTTLEECRGRHISDFIISLQPCDETDPTAPDSLDVEHRGRRSDGEEFPLSLSIGIYEETKRSRVVMVVRDDTELQEMRARMRHLDRMSAVGTLATGVAHEINNPLSYIKSNVKYVEENLGKALQPAGADGRQQLHIDDGGELLEALDDGMHGLDRIEHIVSDLHTFSKEGGDELSAVDIEKCLDSTLSIIGNKIEHQAELTRSISAIPPVLAEEAGLSQVLMNLLLNAVQAIPEGEAAQSRIAVRADVDEDQEMVVISVSDTGVGISEQTQAKIFDPFFTTKKQEGTGLGLSISQKIVDSFDGQLNVESTVGEGTTFRVKLPIAQPEEEVVEDERVPTDELPDIEDKRVLVVDDDRRVCMALVRLLGRACRADGETDAPGVLQRLIDGDKTYDALVVDLMMPYLSGIQFYEQLKKERPELSKRIIFITGGAIPPEAKDLVDNQGVTILSKPFEPAELYNALETITEDHED